MAAASNPSSMRSKAQEPTYHERLQSPGTGIRHRPAGQARPGRGTRRGRLPVRRERPRIPRLCRRYRGGLAGSLPSAPGGGNPAAGCNPDHLPQHHVQRPALAVAAKAGRNQPTGIEPRLSVQFRRRIHRGGAQVCAPAQRAHQFHQRDARLSRAHHGRGQRHLHTEIPRSLPAAGAGF